MLPRFVGVLASLVAILRVQAASCPYATLTVTSVLVDNALCTSTGPCLVNPTTCAEISKATPKLQADGTMQYAVEAVGDMSGYTKLTDLYIGRDGTSPVDVTYMQLPPTLLTLYVRASVGGTLIMLVKVDTYTGLAADFMWPPTLDSFTLRNGPFNAATLPLTPTKLGLDLVGLTKMPPTNTKWRSLNLAGNKIEEVANADLPNLVYLYAPSIFGNLLTTFANVSFTKSLNYFGITGSITTFTVSNATYQVLNELEKLTSRTTRLGYEIDDYMTIQPNETKCTQAGGTIRPLWALKDASRNFAACVLPDPQPRTLAPTTAVPTTSPPLETSNIGLVVGVSASAIVLVLLFGWWCLWKRRKPVPPTPDAVYHRYSTRGTLAGTATVDVTGFPTGSIPSGGDKSRHYVNVDLDVLRMLRLEPSELRAIGNTPMAAGAHGEVWLGTYAGQPVAIKRTKDKSAKAIAKMSAEILLMSRINSPYAVSLIGASWLRPTDLECVVEYMDRGDLRSFLSSTSSAAFSWHQKQESIAQVVQGLVYLHTFETPIIHRDLKSRNVLLDSKKGTKLTDFGESREMDEETLTNGIGTYQWMAPEIFTGHDYSTAADVYSFGVLLSEYSTHRVPYADMINPRTNKPMNQQFIMHQVTSGAITPTFETATTPPWVLELAKQCLAFDPEDRPSTLQIINVVLKATA
ncbi:TKL protein kinase [Saprolegnia diclina VS20]|uniref:TKL protein kinase n=1 Tax=Saprolegnia diclina (strain VS20) TaxID=1156394 RepID=T0RAV2_SAPDV|nr:TKL protein kinase [Saprolegnia diclina VS20]EQC29328.1 TKL protein kinase [Saprolegnia diclina VS20]|eukprot:XP_008617302.1 TKL protein kinase [Saprolegnia diclina VS20]